MNDQICPLHSGLEKRISRLTFAVAVLVATVAGDIGLDKVPAAVTAIAALERDGSADRILAAVFGSDRTKQGQIGAIAPSRSSCSSAIAAAPATSSGSTDLADPATTRVSASPFSMFSLEGVPNEIRGDAKREEKASARQDRMERRRAQHNARGHRLPVAHHPDDLGQQQDQPPREEDRDRHVGEQ